MSQVAQEQVIGVRTRVRLALHEIAECLLVLDEQPSSECPTWRGRLEAAQRELMDLLYGEP